MKKVAFAIALLAVLAVHAEPVLKAPEGISEEEFRAAMNQARSLEIVFRSVYESVRPSVVHIIAERQQKVQPGPNSADPFFFFGPQPRQMPSQTVRSEGSGFFIEPGVIVTNSHVVGPAKKVKIKMADGRTYEGRVKGADSYSDIALVEVVGVQGRPVHIADSDKVHVGEMAIAVGNPMGLEGTFTTGVISAIRKPSPDGRAGKVIQTDAPINVGNSGGPLLNLRGEVIGINFMTISPNGGSVGLGFAIPMNEARTIIAAVRESGVVERPFLGIQLMPIPADWAKDKGFKDGAFVIRVIDGTGAAQAGILPNDVVTSVNGQLINTPDELINYVLTRKIGERVVLEVIRGGQKSKVSILLGKRPDFQTPE